MIVGLSNLPQRLRMGFGDLRDKVRVHEGFGIVKTGNEFVFNIAQRGFQFCLPPYQADNGVLLQIFLDLIEVETVDPKSAAIGPSRVGVLRVAGTEGSFANGQF